MHRILLFMAPVAITLSSIAVTRLGSTYALHASRVEDPVTVTIRSLAASDAFTIDADTLEITVTEGVPVGNLHLLNVRNIAGRQLKFEAEFDGVPKLTAHVAASSLKRGDDSGIWLTGKPELPPGEYNAFLLIEAMDGFLSERIPVTVTVLPRPKKVATVERCLPGTGPDDEPAAQMNEDLPALDQPLHESAEEPQVNSPPAEAAPEAALEAAPKVAHEDAEPLTEIVTEIVWIDCSEGAASEEPAVQATPEGPVPPGDDPAPLHPADDAKPEDGEPGDSEEDPAEEPADEPETPADPEEAPTSPGPEQADSGEEPAPQPEPAREEDHRQEQAPPPEPASEPDLELEHTPPSASVPEPAASDDSLSDSAVESSPVSAPEDAT